MSPQARPMAKVNLTLEVSGRRADGYHDLRSVFLRIGLADSLQVTAGWVGESDELLVSGLPGCPIQGNLVLRAFELLRETVEPRLPALRAELDKQIPLGAGLGGGSSDGAAAIELAAAAWGIGLAAGEAAELARSLGSDVPFFATTAPVALVEGRGEVVTPLPAVAGGAGVLLAISGTELSTARVFARHDELATSGHAAGVSQRLADALGAGTTGADLVELSGELADGNDLWSAAADLLPQLVERRAQLERATGRRWLMSGSGSTLFAIYASPGEAIEAGRRLAAGRTEAPTDVMLLATDLANPDDAWRQAWPSEQ
jgi:4-diphosphocytidyl-2-C-methyl-D-erythritol kinase